MDFKKKIESENAIRDFVDWAEGAYKYAGEAYFSRIRDNLEDIAPKNTLFEYSVFFENSWSTSFTLTAAGDNELKTKLLSWAEKSLSPPNRVICFLLSGQFFLIQAGLKNGVKFVSETDVPFLGLKNVIPPYIIRA